MSGYPITPVAVPTQFQPWQPTDEQIRQGGRDCSAAAAAQCRRRGPRPASGNTTLVCIAGFTIFSEAFPNGFTVSPGEDFEVNDFDLPKYQGKGVRRVDYPG